jgi:hypothetical protein
MKLRALGYAITAVGVVWGCSKFDNAGEAPADAGVEGDATPSVLDGGADAALSFCAANGADAALCDDFERPSDAPVGWAPPFTTLGELAILDGAGRDGSRGLRASTDSPDGGAQAAAHLIFDNAAPASHIECEISVRVKALANPMSMSGPLMVAFETTPGAPTAYVGFGLDGTGRLGFSSTVYGLDGGVVSTGSAVVRKLAFDTWTRLRVIVDLEMQPPKATAFVDGVEVAAPTLDGLTKQAFRLRAGTHYVIAPNGGTATLELDDALVTWR